MKKHLYFVRHGETDYNLQGLFQGRKDIPLNEKGWWQAEQLAENLKSKKKKFFCIYSSPLKRARQTAQVLGKKLNLKIEKSDLLQEISFGDLEGTKRPDRKTFFSDSLDYLDIEFPNGEKVIDAYLRFEKFVSQLSSDIDEILIVSHGALLKSVLVKNNVKNATKYIGNCVCVGFVYDTETKKFDDFEIL